jgi:hypothetical protein
MLLTILLLKKFKKKLGSKVYFYVNLAENVISWQRWKNVFELMK